MKRVCITYHMSKPGEIAETCIALPMEDTVAEDLLEVGSESYYLQFTKSAHSRKGLVRRILSQVSTLQGYAFEEAVDFEEVR